MMMMMAGSCSTKKNTSSTRFWHSFTGKYNTYYNGTLAYIDASEEKEKGNKDNFTEMIPLYTVGNKSSKEIGKANYDRAIEKCQKTIKLHSINKRPEWTKNRPKTEKDIEWLSRKEYNPFMWRAWMLMGRSQFHKGAFDEAAATFSYMTRLYKTQPVIYGKARAWLAKCYVEQEWLYDAEDIIRNMQRDSIDWRAQKEWDYTLADYYLHTGELEKASGYLRKVVKHEMRKKQKAREYFLLGQVEAALGHKDLAYKAFKKVIAQNPPYEVAFNARISMTEVLASSGQGRKMIGRLKRMARNDNNKDYLDQVYYALGNIYLAEKDTTHAIWAYEKGNEKATRSGIEKGVLLLHLGDLYWEMQKYGDARRCYGEAIGMLDKDRKDYKQLSDRSKMLDELVPYTDAIHLQDSLIELAGMSEKDRNDAIDRVIKELKRKEKEERDKAAEAEVAKAQAKYNTGQKAGQQQPKTPTNNTTQQNQTFYFYNPTAVQQGKQTFERQWGKRENEDNWQRANKSVVGSIGSDMAEIPDSVLDAERDSLAAAVEKEEAEKEKMDSAVNDPHKREYYLAQIPFTEEQQQACHEIIKDGLHHSGIIFKDKLDQLALSEKQFMRLLGDYPEFEPKDEIYYHLYLLYMRDEKPGSANVYLDSLKSAYPESQWTTILTDPYFEENARFGKHIEDSLYAQTYDAFMTDSFDVVNRNIIVSDKRFPLGDNRDKFLFISGLSKLNEGDADACMNRLDTLVKQFPSSKVGEIAGMIINGVREGRKLRGARFDMTDVWNRRTAVMADSDSIAARVFSKERDVPFTFMLVYEPDSVNENQILFQLARFNFSNFVVRNFDQEITNDDGLHRMSVAGFRSFDEARHYARVLYQSEAVTKVCAKCRPVVISDENIPLLGQQYSYNQYDSFYVANFQPLEIAKEYMLYEPDNQDDVVHRKKDAEPTPALPTETVAPKGVAPSSTSEDSDEDTIDSIDTIETIEDAPINDDGIIMQDQTEETPLQDDGFIMQDQTEETPQQDDGFIMQDQPEETPQQDDGFIMQDQPEETPQQDDGFIMQDQPEETPQQDDDIILDDGKKEDSKVLEDEYLELEGF